MELKSAGNPIYTTKTIPLNGIYKKIKGIYDPGFNNGESLKLINLEPRSGVILLRDRGDVDGNGNVNLADAIFAIQVHTEMTTSAEINLAADVNGDIKIGPEEAIYVLQKLSELR